MNHKRNIYQIWNVAVSLNVIEILTVTPSNQANWFSLITNRSFYAITFLLFKFITDSNLIMSTKFHFNRTTNTEVIQETFYVLLTSTLNIQTTK